MFSILFFCLMIRRTPRATQSRSSAASDVYKRQKHKIAQRLGVLEEPSEQRQSDDCGQGDADDNDVPFELLHVAVFFRVHELFSNRARNRITANPLQYTHRSASGQPSVDSPLRLEAPGPNCRTAAGTAPLVGPDLSSGGASRSSLDATNRQSG